MHNADYGLVRRFWPTARPRSARSSTLVHDRDHTLTLEVVMPRVERRYPTRIYLYCYKTSLIRCGDNLNFL